jgi:diguanylate cyclase
VTALFYVIPCLLASVIAGYYLGITTRAGKECQEARKEREATRKVLTGLLSATEKISTDVDHYSTEIREVEQSLSHLHVEGELAEIQSALLTQMAAVLEANQQLEDDLSCTRLRMEVQAEEIDKAKTEARTDALSGIGNRKAFDEKLDQFLARWRREETPFVLVMADIDHFKWINDGHGHQAGDMIVENLGSLLKSWLREGDFVARFGGDEFALLLSNVELDRAAEICERLRVLISRANFDFGERSERGAVTFSIGLAACHEGATAEAMLHRADRALYRSKEAGRNKVHTYRSEDRLEPVSVEG